jgi:hypothetical protein
MPTLLLCLRSSDPELTEQAIREAVGEIYPDSEYEITGIARPARSGHVIVEITLPDESTDSTFGPGSDRSRGESVETAVGPQTQILDLGEPEVPSR